MGQDIHEMECALSRITYESYLLLASAPTMMGLVEVTRQVGVFVQLTVGPLQPVALELELSGVGPSLHCIIHHLPYTHETNPQFIFHATRDESCIGLFVYLVVGA